MADDDMHDFERVEFSDAGKAHAVFRKGSGPAVIVLAEIPGTTPRVLDFARRLPPLGFTVVVPHLFGIPGRDPAPEAHGRLGMARSVADALGSICVSREFAIFATGRTSPIVTWLRALAASEHERCGGQGVGVVGMCFTGGFALAMAADDRVIAPVLSQPSLPAPFGRRRRSSIDLSDADLQVVRRRCEAGELRVMGLRFQGDRLCPDERFTFLRQQLGDAFLAIELDPAHANPNAAIPPHSVLTEHLVDQPGQPTRLALERVLQFLRDRLHVEREVRA
jgi:dienelactone hydrolase